MNYLGGLFLVLFVTAITILGDVFIKLAANISTKNLDINRYLIFGALLYFVTGFGWFVVMKKVELSSIGTIYGVATSILLAIIGALFFHENINYIEFIAIAMGVISIFLLVKFAS